MMPELLDEQLHYTHDGGHRKTLHVKWEGDYYIISQTTQCPCGLETFVFASDEDGNIVSYTEVIGQIEWTADYVLLYFGLLIQRRY
tara:strand:+ start:84 stop:341 length:258 start_codon:yes stop_codon:yes gene_type:complete